MKIRNKEKGNNILIVGSGRTIKDYREKILQHIHDYSCIVIGINYMTDLCCPDYHMWTNKQRYRDLGSCISSKSKLIIGGKIPDELVRKHSEKEYIRIKHKKVDDVDFDNEFIYGRFRTCGILSIMVARIMGAETIQVVGMDGYTLYSKEEILNGKHGHHCYGDGYTDDASWERCEQKDEMVNFELHRLRRYGAKFEIITPTKFSYFYNNVLDIGN